MPEHDVNSPEMRAWMVRRLQQAIEAVERGVAQEFAFNETRTPPETVLAIRFDPGERLFAADNQMPFTTAPDQDPETTRLDAVLDRTREGLRERALKQSASTLGAEKMRAACLAVCDAVREDLDYHDDATRRVDQCAEQIKALNLDEVLR